MIYKNTFNFVVFIQPLTVVRTIIWNTMEIVGIRDRLKWKKLTLKMFNIILLSS